MEPIYMYISTFPKHFYMVRPGTYLDPVNANYAEPLNIFNAVYDIKMIKTYA